MRSWQALSRASIRKAASSRQNSQPKTLHPTVLFSRNTATKAQDGIAILLQRPSWSIRSLLPSSDGDSGTPQVTRKQLQHLLRLSALPLPSSAEEEANMLKTLESQLHFVREIQQVDTAGVKPLRALRDETQASDQEQTIDLQALQDALSKEQLVGKHYRRVKRISTISDVKDPSEDWNPLPQAQKREGSYFIVENEKS